MNNRKSWLNKQGFNQLLGGACTASIFTTGLSINLLVRAFGVCVTDQHMSRFLGTWH